VRLELDQLITIREPQDLRSCALGELRTVRDHYQEVENGLSYARRIVQGRLDILSVELERRGEAGGADLMERLPEALAQHTRGPGLPRPVRDLDPPAWADDVVGELDRIFSPSQLGELAELDEAQVIAAAAEVGELERAISAMRSELHRRIDRVQDELVGRYRDGATVDDLLT
jgi:HAMP domain-containing protein